MLLLYSRICVITEVQCTITEGELTEQTELSELGGEPEKNEQYLIADDDGQWFIVKFKDTDQYSAIPSRWLTKDKKNSHWPPSDNTITYYCLRRSKPVEGWTLRCISDIIGQKGNKHA